ncbi:MAG: CRTAC1 family protein [Candidatus Kapabacteria bacterium]|nr:CRTAC1 family protein [Candidatus Kapabacteria bacterium]
MKNILIIYIMLLVVNLPVISADEFKESSLEAGINHIYLNAFLDGGGCAFFDYDNDGYIDLYITGGMQRDKLFHNNGDGTFEELGLKIGLKDGNALASQGVAIADINNDGFDDIYVSCFTGGGDILYRNNGNGTFTDISEKSGILKHKKWSTSVTFGDFNLDGFLDIFVATYATNTQNITYQKNILWMNNKDETFTEKTDEYGIHGKGYSLSVVSTDTDGDNDMDIMVANDFGYIAWPDVLYRNDYPSATFSDISKEAGFDAAINGMGIGVGDFDEDGDLDYYVTNIGKNLLYRNDGHNNFVNVAPKAGVEHGFVNSQKTTSWSPIFFDYDNDTHLDLYFTSGYVGEPNSSFEDPNKLYHSNGDGTFKDVSEKYDMEDLSKSRGSIVGDIDNDGLLDLFVVNLESDFETTNHCRLYKNKFKSAKNNWFKVKTQGTKSNRNGIGAKVFLFAGGTKYIREIDGGSGHMSHNSQIAHWGLGKIKKIDSITVIWPGGLNEKFGFFAPNQLLTIVEKTKIFVTNVCNYEICSGETLFGKIRTKNEIEDITLKSFYGYDSLIKAHIKVKPSYSSTKNIGICLGEKYNKIKLKNDTTFIKKYKSNNFCDSIIVENIFVNKQTDFSQTLTFCENANYEGINYNNSTTITKKLKSITGCDSNVSIKLIVNKAYQSNYNVSLCEGESFKGIPYIYNKEIIEKYKTFEGCDSTVKININILKKAVFNLDTTIFVGQSYNGVLYNKIEKVSLFNKFPKAGQNGCDSILVTNLIVKNPEGVFEGNNSNFELSVAQNKSNGTYAVTFKLLNDGVFTISLFSKSLDKIADLINENGKKGEIKKELNLNSFGFKKGTYFIRVTQNNKFQDFKFELGN